MAALCVPGLLYMVTSSVSEEAGQSHGWQHGWLPFIVIEVGPFLVALWLVRARAPFGSMAAALAILSMMMARIVIDHGQWPRRAWIAAAWLIGLPMRANSGAGLPGLPRQR